MHRFDFEENDYTKESDIARLNLTPLFENETDPEILESVKGYIPKEEPYPNCFERFKCV